MTRLQMRAFTVEDYLTLDALEDEKLLRAGQKVQRWAEVHLQAGPSATFTTPDGRIIFCGGVHDLWPHIGEIWGVFSKLAYYYPHTLQAVKWCIKELVEKMSYVRLQAIIVTANKTAIRFIEHLGFQKEGFMRYSGPHGEDQFLYALIKGDNNG